jgi:hypothetical protein
LGRLETTLSGRDPKLIEILRSLGFAAERRVRRCADCRPDGGEGRAAARRGSGILDAMNLLIRWALNALALWLTVQIGVGVSMSQPGLGPLLIAALVVGLVNAVVRPVMVILTLPSRC